MAFPLPTKRRITFSVLHFAIVLLLLACLAEAKKKKKKHGSCNGTCIDDDENDAAVLRYTPGTILLSLGVLVLKLKEEVVEATAVEEEVTAAAVEAADEAVGAVAVADTERCQKISC
ncbi:hypothetical protein GE09DRAFT_1292577 [Coniochaeta sp. 2T2.1]|nr:hypothetical protein GE09DRAFT_1292577 [Coniochaeta sp. 2T2.1]